MWVELLIRRKSNRAGSSQLTADSQRRASVASVSTSEKIPVVLWPAEGRNELRPYKSMLWLVGPMWNWRERRDFCTRVDKALLSRHRD